jgi:hypothetical protein
MRRQLTVEQRELALQLRATGLLLREIGLQVGCAHQGVALIVRYASCGQSATTAGCPGRGG